ncbi:MAG: DUF4417 domain-containing protein [Eubacterium sp.]|nr:DUF4417 domain-containing protein [Eubacterium sp.]
MKKKKNLRKLLNLGFLDYTELTTYIGELDMPYVKCTKIPSIDYMAIYSRPKTYFRTENTCVTFFEYDEIFDGLYGLWNAIAYGIKELQEFYLERFKGVSCFVAPDYSKCGDIPEIENQHRQFRSRVVAIWLVKNLNAVVIPLVSCANKNGMKYMLDGMEECTVVAFNAKGPMGDSVQLAIFKESIKYTVDHLPKLTTIYVYATSPDKNKVLEVFQYAIDAGIDVRIPDNLLQTRNRIRGGE